MTTDSERFAEQMKAAEESKMLLRIDEPLLGPVSTAAEALKKSLDQSALSAEAIVGRGETAKHLVEEWEAGKKLQFEADRIKSVLGPSQAAIEAMTYAGKGIHDVINSAARAARIFDSIPVPQNVPPIKFPPNPIHETNAKLERTNNRIASMAEGIAELGKVVAGLGAQAAEIRAESNESNRRSHKISAIATAGTLAAVLLAGAQIWVQVSGDSARERLEKQIEQTVTSQQASNAKIVELTAANAKLGDELKSLQPQKPKPALKAP